MGMSRKVNAVFGRSGEPLSKQYRGHRSGRSHSETQRRLERGEGWAAISQCTHGENGKEEGDGRHEGK